MQQQTTATMAAIAATPKATGHVGDSVRAQTAKKADTPAVQPATFDGVSR
jgi:hypothetical protein